MTAYRGFDLVDALPGAAADAPEDLSRTLVTVESLAGSFAIDAPSLTPIGTRSFLWQLNGRPAIAAARAFIAGRIGQKVPCWVPSYQSDLELAAGVSAVATTMLIRAIGYTEAYATNAARQHVAFFAAGALAPKKIIGAVDNGDGTETLTLESALGVSVPNASSLLSFLFFSRLASDDVELLFQTPSYAEATLSFVEVPREVPT